MTKAPYTHRPLVWICVCFACGIVLQECLKIPFAFFSSLAALLMLSGFLTRQTKISTVLLLLSLIFLGAVYAKNHQTFSSDHISYLSYYDRQEPVLVEGVVVSDVEKRAFFKGKKTVFTLEVKRIQFPWGWEEKRGDLLVNLFRQEDVRYGDNVVLEGKLHRPFNFSKESSFSYRDYLYRKGIPFILSVKKKGRVEVLARKQGHFIKDLSLRLKQRLRDVLKDHLPSPEAGLMQAFLLGDRYDIPKNVYDLFKLSGVAHIIAISGFNIGIVAYGIFLFLKIFPIPRQGQYVLTMFLLVFYAFLTGGQPPVVRATIMAVVFLTSFLVEREQEAMNTLCAAALILLLMNPLNLFDVGFQLSFISVFFIILFYSRFMGLFYQWLPGVKEETEEQEKPRRKGRLSLIRFKVIRFFLQSLAISFAAYLGVVALVAYYFRLITPIVIIANLVIVPLASLIIFLGMGLLAMGVIFPGAAFAFANCIVVLLNCMVASVFFFVQIPGAYFQLKSFSLGAVILYYGLIGFLFYGITFIKYALRR